MSAVNPLTVLIVERTGTIKTLNIKDFKKEDLYKKCGFKSSENFLVHCKWNIKYANKVYTFEVYGKTKGKANNENKYDFPPPIDNTLFFGNCLILCYIENEEKKYVYVSLTIDLWDKVYEKLFGGFEDLVGTFSEDENEEDELQNIPSCKKTKTGGYLKDGFVVDTSEEDENIVLKPPRGKKDISHSSSCEEDELTEEEYLS